MVVLCEDVFSGYVLLIGGGEWLSVVVMFVCVCVSLLVVMLLLLILWLLLWLGLCLVFRL